MTEQSLMITTNEQPCDNQQQNLEATHQSCLNSSEYELKIAFTEMQQKKLNISETVKF